MPRILDSDGGPPKQQDLINSLQPTETQRLHFPFITEDQVNQTVRHFPQMFVYGSEWVGGLFQDLCDEVSRSAFRFGLCRPAIILAPSGGIFIVVKLPNVLIEGHRWEELRINVLTLLDVRGVRGVGRPGLRVHLVQWIESHY